MRKQYKFIKHSKTIKSKIPSKTTSCHKRYHSSVSAELSFIGNGTKVKFNQIQQYVENCALMATMFNIVLFAIHCVRWFCFVFQICSAYARKFGKGLLLLG